MDESGERCGPRVIGLECLGGQVLCANGCLELLEDIGPVGLIGFRFVVSGVFFEHGVVEVDCLTGDILLSGGDAFLLKFGEEVLEG